MAHEFRPGDRVRRIKHSWKDMNVGDEATIKECPKNDDIKFEEYPNYTYDADNYELVKKFEAKPEVNDTYQIF